MTVETFFDLFLKELADNKQFWSYYKFLESPDKINFRKAYFCQRLEYILNHVPTNATKIWDCGCGYGTTAIFLALNGFPVYGNTLEFYYEHIPKRLKYWQQFGDVSTFEYSYDNHFDLNFSANTFDAVIAQDTLHHLEPMDEALKIIFEALKKEGIVIAIEENGNNILQNTKLYLQRGNKRIITIQDEKLNKSILLGNENIRSVATWKQLFIKNGFRFNDESVNHIRYFLPSKAQQFDTIEPLILKEQAIQNTFLKNYFFFRYQFYSHKVSAEAHLFLTTEENRGRKVIDIVTPCLVLPCGLISLRFALPILNIRPRSPFYKHSYKISLHGNRHAECRSSAFIS